MHRLLFFIFCFNLSVSFSQSYNSYFTGDTADVKPPTQFGLCLMGGATEEDHAMQWFLQKSGGGDVVVLRTSGTNGYNAYLYSQLGIQVNSVETILFNNASATYDPYVIRRIATAEAIFIAGGDQSTYVNFWRGTPVDSLINYLSSIKKIPIGGTSAGMAILGGAYNSAATGSVTSAQALANPFSNLVTIGQNNFLKLPCMQNTITDTHYDNPDRRGRHVAFLSRMMASSGDSAKGIACDEYTAVCIDSTGIARVFGGAPQYDDNAYFLQINPAQPNAPETLLSGTPLTWDRNHAALKVYNIKGDTSGSRTFDIKSWLTGTGGNWQHWYVLNGVLYTTPGSPPATLPVDFLNIFATQKNKTIRIDWNVAQEQNVKQYSLQRKNTDGYFEDLQIVKATSSYSSNSYSATDAKPYNGENLYRIKSQDADEKVKYFSVVKAYSNFNSQITITPNPVVDYINIRFIKPLHKKYLIKIVNVAGEICQQNYFTAEGTVASNRIHLAQSLRKGWYTIQVAYGDNTIFAEPILIGK